METTQIHAYHRICSCSETGLVVTLSALSLIKFNMLCSYILVNEHIKLLYTDPNHSLSRSIWTTLVDSCSPGYSFFTHFPHENILSSRCQQLNQGLFEDKTGFLSLCHRSPPTPMFANIWTPLSSALSHTPQGN